MPKYINRIEQQLKLIELQKQYGNQEMKGVRRLRTNRILAKSTQNMTRMIGNGLIRLQNRVMKWDRLRIERTYLL